VWGDYKDDESKNDVLIFAYVPAKTDEQYAGRTKKTILQKNLKQSSLVTSTLAKQMGGKIRMTKNSNSSTASVAPADDAGINSTKNSERSHGDSQGLNSTSSINKSISALASTIEEKKVVQYWNSGTWAIKSLSENICEITMVQRSEDKGNIPKKVPASERSERAVRTPRRGQPHGVFNRTQQQ